eukprot:c20812_g3_i16.p1 GENE.c20812_g3_i16~~c20812_g3_i16.p1  ORF type:complete len:149 (-),score=27.24 c20812_g3_i16:200-646(-)
MFPNSPLFGVGFSLGAGILGRYTAEQRSNGLLVGAVLLNPSFDFLRSTAWFHLWSRGYLVELMKTYIKWNWHMLELNKAWLEVWSEHPKHTGTGEMAEMVVHLEYLKSPKSPTQVTALCTAITTGHVLMCGRNWFPLLFRGPTVCGQR